MWQAFEREGKGDFRSEKSARGVQGRREGNACKDTIVFLRNKRTKSITAHFQIWVKILNFLNKLQWNLHSRDTLGIKASVPLMEFGLEFVNSIINRQINYFSFILSSSE